MKDNYYLELIRQKPIHYKELVFHPVSFGYICDHLGLEMFHQILIPFCITKESLQVPDEELASCDLFEDILLKDQGMLTCIALTIQLFCKTDDVRKKENAILVFTDPDQPDSYFTIDKDNFEDICEIILLMNGKEKIKARKQPKAMSNKQREIWEKLQEGRRKEDSKNEVHIYDMLNVCEFGGSYRIPVDEMENWTLWKIMNCYKARMNMKAYDDSLKICLVSGDAKSISGDNHWHHKLLIREHHESQ